VTQRQKLKIILITFAIKEKLFFPFGCRVVAVGGDGIYNEVMSGLLKREMRDHGLNPDNPESKLIPIRLPIGIIPAGITSISMTQLHDECNNSVSRIKNISNFD
jgi:hypothetical protein